MTWILLSCAIVYLGSGAWYAWNHPAEVVVVASQKRIVGILAGLGALLALLTIWPLLIPRKPT